MTPQPNARTVAEALATLIAGAAAQPERGAS